MKIPFNKPLILGNEIDYLKKVINSKSLSGDGKFTQKCNKLIEEKADCMKAIMTPSCTDALEMSALLCNIQSGDEVIMPSYSLVSTASAFVRHNAEIVWCDVREDTKNIDETKIELLFSNKTKAIVVVHYAGISSEMDKILEICKNNNLFLIEDSAHAIDCFYKGKPLGNFGDFAAISFHQTKNIQCGEGGALLVNNPNMIERAEFIRDRGTNRIHFNRGIIDEYEWVEMGSNFLMSELQAAFLYPQLLELQKITQNRLKSWNTYYQLLSEFLSKDKLPKIPLDVKHNGHLFYIILSSIEQRKKITKFLQTKGISAHFHYLPLHKAPFWKGKYNHLELPVTDNVSDTLLRLPLYFNMSKEEIEYVVKYIKIFFEKVD